MGRFSYSVTATLPDRETADRFLAWLADGHIEDVIRGGAISGHAVRLDDSGGRIRIEARYLFESRDAYEAYNAGPAVALRAEGVEKFGDAGVSFERRTGTVAYESGGA
jgi:hypothetical protein